MGGKRGKTIKWGDGEIVPSRHTQGPPKAKGKENGRKAREGKEKREKKRDRKGGCGQMPQGTVEKMEV